MKKYIFPGMLAVLILLGAFKCPIYANLGIPCPSCGMTRAWRLALSGELLDAFLMHPLFWMPPLLILPFFRKKWAVVAMIALLVGVYAVRMVMLFPDTPPMNFNHESLLGGFIR